MGSMALEKEQKIQINVEPNYGGGGSYLQKFRLYETRSVYLFDLLDVCLAERELLFFIFCFYCALGKDRMLKDC